MSDKSQGKPIPANVAQFFPQPFGSAYCDTFNCTTPAKYFLGRPDGPFNICHKLCQRCAEDLVRSTPPELLEAMKDMLQAIQPPAEPPEGMVLISQEDLDALMRLAEIGAKVGEQFPAGWPPAQGDFPEQGSGAPALQEDGAAGQESGEQVSPPPPLDALAYSCPQCGEQFSTPQALAGHTNKHRAAERAAEKAAAANKEEGSASETGSNAQG